MAETLPLFPFSPDWSEPFRERLQWLTDVLPAQEAASEQRIALRARPRTSLRSRLLNSTPRESAALGALLWGQGADELGVPFWPDRVYLTAAVAPAATVLPVSTTSLRRFVAGGLIALWRDAHTYELAEVLATAETQLTLVSPLADGWPAGTQVVPLLRGRLPDQQAIGRVLSDAEQADLAFECELQPDRLSLTASMLSHSGLTAFTAALVVNGALDDQAWHTDSAVPGATLSVDLGAPAAVRRLMIYALSAGYAGSYAVRYSDDAIAWSVAASAFTPALAGRNEVSWSSVGPHQFWQLYLENTPGAGSWLSELEFYR